MYIYTYNLHKYFLTSSPSLPSNCTQSHIRKYGLKTKENVFKDIKTLPRERH